MRQGIPLAISTDKLSREEIERSIGKLKSNEAAWYEFWREEKVPDERLLGIIMKLQKKGSLKVTDTWRGMTLLAVASKIFARGYLKGCKVQLRAF